MRVFNYPIAFLKGKGVIWSHATNVRYQGAYVRYLHDLYGFVSMGDADQCSDSVQDILFSSFKLLFFWHNVGYLKSGPMSIICD